MSVCWWCWWCCWCWCWWLWLWQPRRPSLSLLCGRRVRARGGTDVLACAYAGVACRRGVWAWPQCHKSCSVAWISHTPPCGCRVHPHVATPRHSDGVGHHCRQRGGAGGMAHPQPPHPRLYEPQFHEQRTPGAHRPPVDSTHIQVRRAPHPNHACATLDCACVLCCAALAAAFAFVRRAVSVQRRTHAGSHARGGGHRAVVRSYSHQGFLHIGLNMFAVAHFSPEIIQTGHSRYRLVRPSTACGCSGDVGVGCARVCVCALALWCQGEAPPP